LAAVAFIVRLPLGIALGWLWMRRRSLLAAIALHSAYNLAIVAIIALS
jgi:membrane protease YdiL (CAAX protease family)